MRWRNILFFLMRKLTRRSMARVLWFGVEPRVRLHYPATRPKALNDNERLRSRPLDRSA